MKDQAQMTLHREDNATGLVLYMAMELSEKKWKLAFSDGSFKPNGQLRVYQKSIEGNDWVSLAVVLERARGRFKLSGQVPVLMSMIALMAPPMIGLMEPLLGGDFRVSDRVFFSVFSPPFQW